MVAFNSYVHRLSTIHIINQDFDFELQHIKNIGITNGYNEYLVLQVLNKKTKTIPRSKVYIKIYKSTNNDHFVSKFYLQDLFPNS